MLCAAYFHSVGCVPSSHCQAFLVTHARTQIRAGSLGLRTFSFVRPARFRARAHTRKRTRTKREKGQGAKIAEKTMTEED